MKSPDLAFWCGFVHGRKEKETDRHDGGAHHRIDLVATRAADQDPADNRSRQQATHQWNHLQTGTGGTGPFHDLQEERQKGHRPEQGETENQPERTGDPEDLVPKEFERQDWFRDSFFDEDKAAQ